MDILGGIKKLETDEASKKKLEHLKVKGLPIRTIEDADRANSEFMKQNDEWDSLGL